MNDRLRDAIRDRIKKEGGILDKPTLERELGRSPGFAQTIKEMMDKEIIRYGGRDQYFIAPHRAVVGSNDTLFNHLIEGPLKGQGAGTANGLIKLVKDHGLRKGVDLFLEAHPYLKSKEGALRSLVSRWYTAHGTTNPLNLCPTCGQESKIRCRCKIGDQTCPDGHKWFICPVHKTHVPGQSDHSQGFDFKKCYCQKASEDTVKEQGTTAIEQGITAIIAELNNLGVEVKNGKVSKKDFERVFSDLDSLTQDDEDAIHQYQVEGGEIPASCWPKTAKIGQHSGLSANAPGSEVRRRYQRE